MKTTILYEDSALLVVSKPNNALVHSSYYARNIKEPSVLEDLEASPGYKLYPVHRLDYKTSGALIFAKSTEAANAIQKQFEEGLVQKTYTALVRGYTEPKGKIDTPVKNPDNGKYKDALTHYETLSSIEVDIAVTPYPKSRYSLIQFFPHTGRMHQLRIHANKISHPIIGDHRYGNRHHNRMFENQLDLANLFLHAKEIEFNHPESGDSIKIFAPFPDFWHKLKTALQWELPDSFFEAR